MVPIVKLNMQVAPQSMPLGVLVTKPDPLPALDTVSVAPAGARSNCTATVWSPVRATVHVAIPLHPPPLQPPNVEPSAGAAVNVTTVPMGNAVAHVLVQPMPEGVLVTVPAPKPV